jgi:hypothetical protein
LTLEGFACNRERMTKLDEALAWLEELGGGYVQDDEVSAITLMDVALTDDQASSLLQVSGFQQLAINASALSLSTLVSLGRLEGLESLVLGNCALSDGDIRALKQQCPSIEIELV